MAEERKEEDAVEEKLRKIIEVLKKELPPMTDVGVVLSQILRIEIY